MPLMVLTGEAAPVQTRHPEHQWEPLRPDNYKQRKRRYLCQRCGITGSERDIRSKLAKRCDPYRWQRMADKLKRRRTAFESVEP